MPTAWPSVCGLLREHLATIAGRVSGCGRVSTGDPARLNLLRHHPFPDAPPRYVRARFCLYRFYAGRTPC